MINNELLSFIKERLSQGETKEQVTEMLVANGGWDHKDVEEAFDAMDMSGSSLPSLLNAIEKETEAQKNPPKEMAAAPAIQNENIKAPMTAGANEVSAQPAPVSAIDTDKIQFAEPTSAPILTTAAMPATPVSFTPPPITRFVSTTPPPESSTPPPMEIPKIAPQDVSEVTVVSNTPVSEIKPTIQPLSAVSASAPFSSRPETPAPVPAVAAAPAEEVKIDETLQSLRTRFMQGRAAAPSTPPVSEPSSGAAKTTPFVVGIKGLSPHTQSGMTPSEKPMNISTAPIVQTAKIAPRSVQPVSILSQMQKPGMLSGQRASAAFAAQTPQVKMPGRGLFGFFMLLTGMILGAVAMHAYLNGYIMPFFSQITALI